MLLIHLLIKALIEPPLGLRLRLWLCDPLLSAFNNLKGSNISVLGVFLFFEYLLFSPRYLLVVFNVFMGLGELC